MEWWAPPCPPFGSGQGAQDTQGFSSGQRRLRWQNEPQQVGGDLRMRIANRAGMGGGDSVSDGGDRPGWQGVSHSGHPARRERCAPCNGLFMLLGGGAGFRGLVPCVASSPCVQSGLICGPGAVALLLESVGISGCPFLSCHEGGSFWNRSGPGQH